MHTNLPKRDEPLFNDTVSAICAERGLSKDQLDINQLCELRGFKNIDELSRAHGFAGFADILKRVKPVIGKVVRGMAKRNVDAEDMEALIHEKILRNLVDFKGTSTITTWAHMIARNTCLSYLQRSPMVNEVSSSDLFADSDDQDAGDEGYFARSLSSDEGAMDPATRLEMREATDRLGSAINITLKSRKKSGGIGILIELGFDALAHLINTRNPMLKSVKAEFIAEAIAMAAEAPLTKQQLAAMTEELGGKGVDVTTSFEQLRDLATKFGCYPDVNHNQAAFLAGRELRAQRCQKSRSWAAVKGHVFATTQEQAVRAKMSALQKAGVLSSQDAEALEDELEAA